MNGNKNIPKKKRTLYRKSEQNKYDLENKKSKVKKLSFANTILNVIKTLFDSGYIQTPSQKITQMNDYLSDFDNGDYDWLTAEEDLLE